MTLVVTDFKHTGNGNRFITVLYRDSRLIPWFRRNLLRALANPRSFDAWLSRYHLRNNTIASSLMDSGFRKKTFYIREV